MNIVVLISGNGSNLQAIIDACKTNKIKGTVRAVFSNKADAFGLERARQALMNPLMILVKIIKLRWIHILSYDQMVSRKINNQTTRCANSIF
ncbi:formyltransferase family protein, partial [Escherichia coli]|uniref:formyltransferase family protein n=1 Tax=Escherichia coli TaxID=562 RepID=UPI00255745AE